MYKRLVIILLALFIGAGCQSSENPSIPGDVDITGDDTRIVESSGNGRVLWGLYEWVIDTQNDTFEALPLRSAEMHINASKFIDMPPTKFNFSNFEVNKPESTISLDVGITHPFPSKPNLAGFDVRGIIIGAGTVSGFEDPSIVIAGPDEVNLLNTDGVTRWWNPVEFQHANTILAYRDGTYGIKYEVGNYNCTLNGYKLFADDLGKNEHPDGLDITDRAVFSNGATNTRHYTLFFPQQDDKFILRFNYAIDASWEAIPGYLPGDPVDLPDSFDPGANMPEAFRIDVNTDFNSLYYEDDVVKGGSMVYEVKVFDWQGYLGAGDVADEITEVKIESPECFTGSFTGIVTDPGSGSQAYAVYEVTIDGSALMTNEVGDALITVVSANGDYQDSLTGYSGTAPLASYEIFPFADVSPTAPPENEAPNAEAVSDKLQAYVDETVTFDATASSDDDGIIISYEWDFDGDGTYGDTYFAGTDIEPQVKWSTIGNYQVDLRVTDDDDATDTLNEPIEIQIITVNNIPPEAVAEADKTEIFPGESISFDGTGSYDTDGMIVLYEWDLDGDGTYGDPYDAGIDAAPVKQYDDLGEYDVDLMVTDDDDATDTLNDVITIYVVSPQNDPPVAAGEIMGTEFWEGWELEFDGSASFDPDGTVEQWLWDFDNDGIYGDPIDSGTDENPFKAFPAGSQTVDLKVIDNGGRSDTLDELITFDVRDGVIIEIEEDQFYKSGTGFEFYALTCYTPDMIGIDYMDPHGPWDFTTQPYDDVDIVQFLDTSDPEVTEYNDGYPASVQYYTRYDVMGMGMTGVTYMPEEADIAGDILWVFGHVEKADDMDTGAAISYVDADGGPIGIQYPWTAATTNEYWDLVYASGEITFAEIIYTEVGVGEGDVAVPFDGVWNTQALVTRVNMEYKLGGQSAVRILMYKWTEDDGRQVARLFSINTNSVTNFDETTFEITGESRLEALKTAL